MELITEKENVKPTAEKICIQMDVSNGVEHVPISVVVDSDDEKVTAPVFKYVKTNIYLGKSKKSEDSPACECSEDCGSECLCNFRNSSCQQVYRDQRIHVLSHEELGELDPIHECTPACPCPETCSNRLVQSGIRVPLEVFYAGKKGFGLRSTQDVPRGTFVCEYAGLFRKRNSKKALDDSYFMQHKAWKNTWIDARENGNVGRFINHSCAPNLTSIRVMWDSEDPETAHIALFAAEDIFAGQELSIDYGESYWIPKFESDNTFLCKCGETECKFATPEDFEKLKPKPNKRTTPAGSGATKSKRRCSKTC